MEQVKRRLQGTPGDSRPTTCATAPMSADAPMSSCVIMLIQNGLGWVHLKFGLIPRKRLNGPGIGQTG